MRALNRCLRIPGTGYTTYPSWWRFAPGVLPDAVGNAGLVRCLPDCLLAAVCGFPAVLLQPSAVGAVTARLDQEFWTLAGDFRLRRYGIPAAHGVDDALAERHIPDQVAGVEACVSRLEARMPGA